MELDHLSDIDVSIGVVKEAVVALSSQVIRLDVLARVLQDRGQSDDSVQEEPLPDLAQSDVHVAFEESFVHVGALLERHLRANTALLLEVSEDQGRLVAGHGASASFLGDL